MDALHAEHVKRHWYWRPGWRIGRSFYTWHITFSDQPEVISLAARYRRLLGDQPNLDLIPDQWLHLTMQGVGFADEVDQVEAIVAAVRSRCAMLSPIRLKVGAANVDPESVQIAVEPADEIRRLRHAIRSGIADIWGSGNVPEPADPYTPHISFAYVNADGPAAPLVSALKSTPTVGATALVETCQLILLNRDDEMYVWRPIATVDLGGS